MLHLPPGYRRPDVAEETPTDFPDYRTTALRSPRRPLTLLPQRLTELTGPVFGEDRVLPGEADLTIANGGEALGQRIEVHGRVLDANGKPVPHTLLEVWQANAAGRYRHTVETGPRRWTRTSTATAGASPTRTGTTGSPPSSPAPTRGATTTTPGARRISISRCSGAASPSGW